LCFLFAGILLGLIAGKLFIPYHKENVIASENPRPAALGADPRGSGGRWWATRW